MRNIFFQIALLACGFFFISSSGCDAVTAHKIQLVNDLGDTITFEKTPRVAIITDFGDMIIELSDSTPAHRDNFLKLASDGFYDNLLFHRVINGFMIQGGDPKSKGAAPNARLGDGGPGYTIPAEIRPDHLHTKGALAAARQGDRVNPEKRSSGSQFYIVQGKTWTDTELSQMEMRANAVAPSFKFSDENKEAYKTVGGTPFLDMNYTVFGHVVEGLDIIDSIAKVQTLPGDRPEEDVKFSVEILK